MGTANFKTMIGFMVILYGSLAFARAGGMEGGGGKTVVCRDELGRVKSIELLDIFEARSLYGLNPKSMGADLDENLNTVKSKFANIYKDATFITPMDHWIDRTRQIFRLLPTGVELTPVNDAAEIAIPKGCKLEQLAFYKDDTLLLVNQDLWNLLDNTNKAALIVHEAVYRVEREHGDKDSRRARKVTGHLFSDFGMIPILEGIPKSSKYCYAQKNSDPNSMAFAFEMYDHPTNKKMSVLQFSIFRNRVPYSKMTLNSFIWPWNEAYSDLYLETQSNFESFDGIMLRREYDSQGKLQGYFFDEPDGRHMIYCH